VEMSGNLGWILWSHGRFYGGGDKYGGGRR